MENIQIEEIREKIEALMKDPEFEKMSKAFKAAVEERIDINELKEQGFEFQIQTPITLGRILKNVEVKELDKIKSIPLTMGDILKAARISDPRQLKNPDSITIKLSDIPISYQSFEILKPNPEELDLHLPLPPVSGYANVYSYSNW